MKFMVIDMWENLPSPAFVTDEDGNVKVFDTYDEAKEEADDCQDGLIITDGRVFTMTEVLNLISSIEQAIWPENFKSSIGLNTMDFGDLALSKAQEFGIEQEFKDYMNADENYIGEY